VGVTTLEIARLDGGLLVLEGGALSEQFFTRDPSSVGEGSYDSLAGKPPRDEIHRSDIEALNRTMRARTPHDRWASITETPLPWLRAIEPALDLIETNDEQWNTTGGERLVDAALAASVGPGRGVSVATKMLHLKRPRLFPVLDLLVAEMLGARISPEAPPDVRARQATRLVLHLRDQGRHNIRGLREIQTSLTQEKMERTLVRILDAVLWLSHPGAGVGGTRRIFECRLADPKAQRVDSASPP
jgi:hypothetical protein